MKNLYQLFNLSIISVLGVARRNPLRRTADSADRADGIKNSMPLWICSHQLKIK